MKMKFTLMLVAAFAVFGNLKAQEYNLFDKADVDENGWLWFDSQEKIDKYVSLFNENDGVIDPAGKVIQMSCAAFGDYEPTIADPELTGFGEPAKKGGIKLAKSEGFALNNYKGGSIYLRLPSCTHMSVCLSSDDQMRPELKVALSEDTFVEDYQSLKAFGFTPLSGAGETLWADLQDIKNSVTTPSTIKSDSPIFVKIANGREAYLIIHGIKVLTSTPTSINNVESGKDIMFDGRNVVLTEVSDVRVYDLTGAVVMNGYTNNLNLEALNKGIYIVKANSKTIKVCLR